jgi:GNAT superfamily N-acetyltransferase
MRVAISGTHCCGKSTLIDEFLLTHPDFAHEPEPYEALQEEHGETFGAELSAEDFHRQLEYCVERLAQHRPGECVIFERSPVDFIAYMLALADLGRDPDGSRLATQSRAAARRGLQDLDVVVFLHAENEVPDSEDPELRAETENQLESILIDDSSGLLPSKLLIIEAFGSTAQRLKALEVALTREGAHKLRAPRNEEEWRAYHEIRRRVLFEKRGEIGVYDDKHPDEFQPLNHPLILFYEAAPIGVIRVDVRDQVAWLRRVAVREDKQRRGHGRAMLSLAEDFARDHGCHEVRSNVAVDAVRFYEHCGYVHDDMTVGTGEGMPMCKSLH